MRTSARPAAPLTPIGTDEIPVSQLVQEVHRRFCSLDGQVHDPACNTLRLLAEDQAQLAARLGTYEGTTQ